MLPVVLFHYLSRGSLPCPNSKIPLRAADSRAGARAPSRWFFRAATLEPSTGPTGNPPTLVTIGYIPVWSMGVTPRFIHQLESGREHGWQGFFANFDRGNLWNSTKARKLRELWDMQKLMGFNGLLPTTGLGKKLGGKLCDGGHQYNLVHVTCVYVYHSL